ncbi:MAG: transporter [Paramuribaculum sp.]|nr:transporter [Paramuribaculum sp.]
MRQRIKPFMLPVAMLGGLVFHEFMDRVQFLAPYLIFVMLFITFCRIKPREIRVTSLSWSLLAVQVLGSIGVYIALLPIDETVAQGVFICVFCPTATAAPVITGMLGGSVPRLATFSIISNMAVAILAPVLFTFMGSADIGFLDTIGYIARNVVPLILLPLVAAWTLMLVSPKTHKFVAEKQGISFYIWAVSLFIVVGRAVSFVMAEPADMIPEMLLIAFGSGVVCIAQFWIGRKVGAKNGDRIAGAQGLGQKNTVLAVWMALTYLNPVASVGPAAYIAWQNSINSLQLYYKTKREIQTNI